VKTGVAEPCDQNGSNKSGYANLLKQARKWKKSGKFRSRCMEEVYEEYTMRNSIFWDITPCSTVKVNRDSEEHIASIFRVEEQSGASS
jgi:hypothetical protein